MNILPTNISTVIEPTVLYQLLLKPKYSGIEKIKTIGSTYMAASGLDPGKEPQVIR